MKIVYLDMNRKKIAEIEGTQNKIVSYVQETIIRQMSLAYGHRKTR